VAGHRDARRARGLPPCIAPAASAPKPRGAHARLRSVCRRHRLTFEFYPGWKRASTRWKDEVHKWVSRGGSVQPLVPQAAAASPPCQTRNRRRPSNNIRRIFKIFSRGLAKPRLGLEARPRANRRRPSLGTGMRDARAGCRRALRPRRPRPSPAAPALASAASAAAIAPLLNVIPGGSGGRPTGSTRSTSGFHAEKTPNPRFSNA
jgi:hypothetical protein